MATYTQRKEPKKAIDIVAENNRKKLSVELANNADAPLCKECDEPFHPKRKALGYDVCLDCGEPQKIFTVVPVPKSNYVVATSPDQLLSPYSHKGNR